MAVRIFVSTYSVSPVVFSNVTAPSARFSVFTKKMPSMALAVHIPLLGSSLTGFHINTEQPFTSIPSKYT
ncbi:MAG: hypothetical protein IKR05_11050 [Prevotella sp.]|nr:hypothetical protein [Prevotella sp.]